MGQGKSKAAKKSSKEDDEKKEPKPTRKLRSRLESVPILINHWFRSYFGVIAMEKNGHFVSEGMTSIIRDYSKPTNYIRGNQNIKGHRDNVICAAVSWDGLCLYTASKSGVIMQRDLLNLSLIAQWTAHRSSILCLSVHSSALLASGGGSDNTVKLWKTSYHNDDDDRDDSDDGSSFISPLEDQTMLHCLLGHRSDINCLSFFFYQSQLCLASGSRDQTIRIWSVQSGDCLTVINSGIISSEGDSSHLSSVIGLFNLSNEDSKLLSVNCDGCIELRKGIEDDHSGDDCAERFDLVANADGFKGQMKTTLSVSINCDESLLCVRNYSLLTMRRIDVTYKIKFGSFMNKIREITTCVKFHPFRPHLMAVGCRHKNQVRLYNAKSGSVIARLGHHHAIVNDLCFTDDGSLLISVSDDWTVKLWDLRPKRE